MYACHANVNNKYEPNNMRGDMLFCYQIACIIYCILYITFSNQTNIIFASIVHVAA